MDKIDYIIHTDGGYSQKYNIGGFAYIICDAKDNELKHGAWKIENETNNRAELKAIIAALHNLPNDAKRVIVISDSQYALNTCSGNWKRKLNKDLFVIHDEIVKKRGLKVSYEWVKGHDGDYYNELCDKLCNEVAGFDLNEEYRKYFKK